MRASKLPQSPIKQIELHRLVDAATRLLKPELADIHRDELDHILSQITKREREVLTLRYGLQGEDPHTQREVAKLLNTTQPTVSKIENKALRALRKIFINSVER